MMPTYHYIFMLAAVSAAAARCRACHFRCHACYASRHAFVTVMAFHFVTIFDAMPLADAAADVYYLRRSSRQRVTITPEARALAATALRHKRVRGSGVARVQKVHTYV